MKQEIKDLMAADLEPLELHRIDAYTKEENLLLSSGHSRRTKRRNIR